ncbi:hypothetical protein Aperf_G00000112208 [Anoplocephala perfoliata]
MDDKELKAISRDPRFAGRLKKKTKKEKEAFKRLFDGLEEEETFKDKRGRPWPRKPLKYAKQLIKEEEQKREEEDSDTDASSSDSEDLSDSESDMSSTEGSTVEENLADLQEADWYELVKDSEEVEKATRRLAVLHFDWDNSNAETIFLALESFLPPGSTLEKVTIYPSEYGMRKMAEEEKHGPKDIWADSDDDNNGEVKHDAEPKANLELPTDMDADEKKAWKYTSVQMRRRLRRYQLQRLKFFYAIAEFDSKETAAAVYEACDGVEFANTGIRFDLRFVNDEETFSVPPEWSHAVSECCEVNRAKYKPRAIENTALHSTRITLSWDQTPAARTQWLREQFEPEAEPKKLFSEGKAQLSEYLALSSSGQSTAAPSDVDEPGPAPTVPRIHRHRPRKVPPEELRAALLSAITDDSAKADEKSGAEDDKNEGEDPQDSTDPEEEEVLDLNESGGKASSSEEEEYDLTAEDDATTSKSKKKGNKKISLVSTEGGRKTVSKKYLPEAIDDDDSDSSLDFDDMDRLSDASDEDGAVGRRKKRRRIDENDDEESKETKKKERKLAMRKKAQMKKQKQEKNREKLKELWTGANENDSRFDIFLRDPTFGVSQMHRDYKEATEFLNFMRRRRGPLLAKKKVDEGVPSELGSSST